MGKNVYRMTDEEFADYVKRHPYATRSDISEVEELLTHKMQADMALHAQLSEIELLKNKALGAMGTAGEMRFSDIESGMLRASLSDGRQALKEIIEKTHVEAPPCSDGTKMKNQGREKKHNVGLGRY